MRMYRRLLRHNTHNAFDQIKKQDAQCIWPDYKSNMHNTFDQIKKQHAKCINHVDQIENNMHNAFGQIKKNLRGVKLTSGNQEIK